MANAKHTRAYGKYIAARKSIRSYIGRAGRNFGIVYKLSGYKFNAADESTRFDAIDADTIAADAAADLEEGAAVSISASAYDTAKKAHAIELRNDGDDNGDSADHIAYSNPLGSLYEQAVSEEIDYAIAKLAELKKFGGVAVETGELDQGELDAAVAEGFNAIGKSLARFGHNI